MQLSQTLSPSHCLLAHLTGLGPCELSVWGHVCPGHPPAPNQGRCPQALLSPPSPDLGVWVQPRLTDSHRLTGVGDSSFGYGLRSHKEKGIYKSVCGHVSAGKEKISNHHQGRKELQSFSSEAAGARTRYGVKAMLDLSTRRGTCGVPQPAGAEVPASLLPRARDGAKGSVARLALHVWLHAGGRPGSAAMGQAWDGVGLVDCGSILNSHGASAAPPLFS